MVKTRKKLKIKIYADGANIKEIIKLNNKKIIKGFTTNPSLIKNNGIKNYKKFALDLLKHIKYKPISFEVISDDFYEMERQAREISSWGRNVFVKIPVTNTKNEYSGKLIKKLSDEGLKINVTAIFTILQVKKVIKSLNNNTPSNISIFAGRIADTGIDPKATILESLKMLQGTEIKLIWASPREVYNIFEADNIGCDIITITIQQS